MRSIEWWHCHFLHFAPPFTASYRVNPETSNLVHWLTIARLTLPKKIFPERGVVRVKQPILKFYTPCNISATANARDFRFCTRVGHVRSQLCGEWMLPKWTWSGSREQFLHCGLRKFRHSKSSVYRWYPQVVRRRFVYDTSEAMKATRRVMVECT